MLLVGPKVANGLKGGEVRILDVKPPLNMLNRLGLALGIAWLLAKFLVFRLLPLVPKGCWGLDFLGCPLEALDFSCGAITEDFIYNGFLCVLNGVRDRFNILPGSESSKTVSSVSLGKSSFVMHHNGCSSWSSNIKLRSPPNIDFEKSFLVLVSGSVTG
eukprot:Gb_13800 [translate_table: standard]